MSNYILASLLLLLLQSGYSVDAKTLPEHDDSTINDQATHLVWQKHDDGLERTWFGAVTYCEALSLAGRTDWRVPTNNEIKSTVEMSSRHSSDNTSLYLLSMEQVSMFWSSTTDESITLYVWFARYIDGLSHYFNHKYLAYVRCVRKD